MGKPKKYDLRSINFGEPGHPARILVAKFVERNGKTGLSGLIRKLVIVYLQNKSEYKDWEKDLLIHKRKELGKEIAHKVKEKVQVDEELRQLGINPDDLF